MNMDYKEAWEELKDWLKTADFELHKMANENKSKRLQGKHEGVRLALTYMDEFERMV